jgi:hypothetical protein
MRERLIIVGRGDRDSPPLPDETPESARFRGLCLSAGQLGTRDIPSEFHQAFHGIDVGVSGWEFSFLVDVVLEHEQTARVHLKG